MVDPTHPLGSGGRPLHPGISATAVLLFVCLLAGCTGGAPPADQGDVPSPAEVRSAVANGSFEDFTANTTIVTRKNGTVVKRVRGHVVIKRVDDVGMKRVEYWAPEARAGDVVVSNRTMELEYDASEHTVETMDGTRPPRNASTFLEGQRVVSVEHATVDGRAAYAVTLRPPDSRSGAFDRLIIWFDATHWVPLRIDTFSTIEGEQYSYSRFYSDVSFNTGVEDDRFHFHVPAGADLTHRERPSTIFESIEALDRATSVPVPRPDVPDPFAFDAAVLYERGNRTFVSLAYEKDGEDAGSFLSIGVYPNGSLRGGENVTVNGRSGRYRSENRTEHDRASRTLSWRCEGARYQVFVLDPDESIDRTGLRAIAESIACPAGSAAG